MKTSDEKTEQNVPIKQAENKITRDSNGEILHDITLEDMDSARIGPTLNITLDSMHESDKKIVINQRPEEIPDEKSEEPINVIDFKGSGKEIVQNNTLAMDNEKLEPEVEIQEFMPEISENNAQNIENSKNAETPIQNNDNSDLNEEEVRPLPPEIKPHHLEIIQEINSEFSNSNSLISGRSTRRKMQEPNSFMKKLDNKDSFFTARDTSEEPNPYRRKVKSSRGNYEPQETILEQQENQEPPKEETKESLGTPLAPRKTEPNNISSNSIMITKTIPRGLQLATSSTNYTTLRAKNMQIPFSSQIWGQQSTSDALVLPTTGVLFASTPSAGFGENTKCTMYNSFMSKPTLAEYSSNLNGRQTPSSQSFFTIKKLSDDSMDAPTLIKINKKNIIPMMKNKPKLNISIHTDNKGAICVKRVRIKKTIAVS